jgi:hypothetical protein
MDSHPVPKEYAEKHTLVMIPTLKSTNEEGDVLHSDFNTLQASGKSLGLSTAKKQDLLMVVDLPGLPMMMELLEKIMEHLSHHQHLWVNLINHHLYFKTQYDRVPGICPKQHAFL